MSLTDSFFSWLWLLNLTSLALESSPDWEICNSQRFLEFDKLIYVKRNLYSYWVLRVGEVEDWLTCTINQSWSTNFSMKLNILGKIRVKFHWKKIKIQNINNCLLLAYHQSIGQNHWYIIYHLQYLVVLNDLAITLVNFHILVKYLQRKYNRKGFRIKYLFNLVLTTMVDIATTLCSIRTIVPVVMRFLMK